MNNDTVNMFFFFGLFPELRIRIRMDPELWSGPGFIVLDQEKIKEQIYNLFVLLSLGLGILDCVYCTGTSMK